MTFEMEIVSPPDLSKLNWSYDSGRDRVLVKTGRFARTGRPAIDVRVTANSAAEKPPSASYQKAEIELDDGRARPESVYFEDLNEDPIIDWWFDDVQDAGGQTISKTFTYRFDRSEIVAQYQDGEWAAGGISTGDITVRFSLDYYATAEASARLVPPADAAVRDNVRVSDLSFDVSGGTAPQITPTVTIDNPANHAVDYPVRVVVRADGRRAFSDNITIQNLSGAVGGRGVETSTATLPTVSLPSGTREATVFIEPRAWAAEFGETYSESISTDLPVPSDVQIVACDMSPSRVRAPAEVEMAATLENPTPLRVETELTFTLGGRSETETVTLDPNERYTDRQRVAVLSGGTKQGSVEITSTQEV